MHAAIYDKYGNAVVHPFDLTVRYYRARRLGGYEQAEVEVDATTNEAWAILGWLGYELRIFDANLQVVWVGQIDECTVAHGNTDVGLSLKGMANAIAVAYVNSQRERQTTAWASDLNSVYAYGQRQLLLSLSEGTHEMAIALRNRRLEKFAKPQRIRRRGGSAHVIYATGYYGLLEYKYANLGIGRDVQAVDEPIEQIIGWQFSTTEMPKIANRWYIFGNQFDNLYPGLKIVVSHNGTPGFGISNVDVPLTVKSVRSGAETTGVTMYNPSFEQFDDIELPDTEQGNLVKPQDVIHISDGVQQAENDGFMYVTDVFPGDPTRLEISPSWSGNLITEGPIIPGPTMRVANHVEIAEPMGNHLRSQADDRTWTVSGYGQKISFSFTPNYDWSIGEIWLPVGKVGEPTDALAVSICTDDGGGLPGAVILTAQIDAADLYIGSRLTRFSLIPTAMTTGATYHVVIERSGAQSGTTGYTLQVQEDDSTPILFWDGAAWQSDTGKVGFELWGVDETTNIIKMLAEQSQLFNSVELRVDSQIYAKTFFTGDTKIMLELERLLNMGTLDGKNLVAYVDGDRNLIVATEPTPSQATIVVEADGQIRNKLGQPLPSGYLPIGEWVEIADLPGAINEQLDLSPFLVDAAEWSDGSLTVDPIVDVADAENS